MALRPGRKQILNFKKRKSMTNNKNIYDKKNKKNSIY